MDFRLVEEKKKLLRVGTYIVLLQKLTSAQNVIPLTYVHVFIVVIYFKNESS